MGFIGELVTLAHRHDLTVNGDRRAQVMFTASFRARPKSEKQLCEDCDHEKRRHQSRLTWDGWCEQCLCKKFKEKANAHD